MKILLLCLVALLVASCGADEAGLQGGLNSSDVKVKFSGVVVTGASSIVTTSISGSSYQVDGTGAGSISTRVDGTNLPHVIVTESDNDKLQRGMIVIPKVDHKLGAVLIVGDEIELLCNIDDDEKVGGVLVGWELDNCYLTSPIVGFIKDLPGGTE